MPENLVSHFCRILPGAMWISCGAPDFARVQIRAKYADSGLHAEREIYSVPTGGVQLALASCRR